MLTDKIVYCYSSDGKKSDETNLNEVKWSIYLINIYILLKRSKTKLDLCYIWNSILVTYWHTATKIITIINKSFIQTQPNNLRTV